MTAGPIYRAAQWSDPGYLERLWRDVNGDWDVPGEDDIRAFLRALSREVEGVTP